MLIKEDNKFQIFIVYALNTLTLDINPCEAFRDNIYYNYKNQHCHIKYNNCIYLNNALDIAEEYSLEEEVVLFFSSRETALNYLIKYSDYAYEVCSKNIKKINQIKSDIERWKKFSISKRKKINGFKTKLKNMEQIYQQEQLQLPVLHNSLHYLERISLLK